MIRSFLAIELKNPDTIDNIREFGSRLKKNQPRMKLVEPENLHITIKFFGNISEQLAPKIYSILEKEVNEKIFQNKILDYYLKGVGQFRKYSVFWIKLKGNIQLIQNAKNKLEDLLYNQLDIRKDKRKDFRPHLTIGRLRKDRMNYKNLNSLKNIIKENKNKDFGAFSIKEIKLKKSQLTPKGPIYTDLKY